jgi:WD40 repeat protein
LTVCRARFATAATDRTVRLWDAATGQEMLALEGLPSAPQRLAFRDDGCLAAGCEDGILVYWEIAPHGR